LPRRQDALPPMDPKSNTQISVVCSKNSLEDTGKSWEPQTDFRWITLLTPPASSPVPLRYLCASLSLLPGGLLWIVFRTFTPSWDVMSPLWTSAWLWAGFHIEKICFSQKLFSRVCHFGRLRQAIGGSLCV
jgi:hypothetical protein